MMPDEGKVFEHELPPDRRSSQRWSTHLVVRYGLGSDLIPGDGYDISETGLGVTGERLFPAGTLIEVNFRVDAPHVEFFKAKGIVRHSGEGKMGVEFVDLGPAQRAEILEMIYLDIALRRR